MSLRARLGLVAVLSVVIAALAGCDNDSSVTTSSDVDGDRIANDVDNCPTAPNPSQTDADADGFGDACDCDRDPSACLVEATVQGNCADGLDNDGDGRRDAADPNCGTEGVAQGNCGDGVDNDGDSVLDCAEASCAGAPGCPGGP